jgi:hypothetical protein
VGEYVREYIDLVWNTSCRANQKIRLNRIEAYTIRARYGMSMNRTEVSAKFYPPGGWFAMFLRVLYLHGLRVVVSPAQGSGYTRVRLDPTGRKAKKSGERMMLEEFDVATRDLGS